jgi:hypothetical protein
MLGAGRDIIATPVRDANWQDDTLLRRSGYAGQAEDTEIYPP